MSATLLRTAIVQTNEGLDLVADPSSVRSLVFRGPHLSDDALRHVHRFHSVEELHIEFPANDDVLRYVPELTRLNTLTFRGAHLTAAGISILTHLSSLQCLRLYDTCISSCGYAALKNLSSFHELVLRLSDTKQELEAIALLTSLRSLTLRSNDLSDPHLSNLAKLVSLESLALLSSLALDPRSEMDDFAEYITSDGLSRLRDLTSLRKLILHSLDPQETNLTCLNNFPHLERLDIPQTAITESSIARMTNLGALRKLSADSISIQQSSARSLPLLQHIREVELCDPSIAALALMPNLTSLKLICDVDHYEGQIASLEKLPTLCTLEIFDPTLPCSDVSDALFSHISKIASLEVLSLYSDNITDNALVHLHNYHALRKLCLEHSTLTDLGIEHLAGLTSLQHLELPSAQVTDAGLAHLGRLTALRHLDLPSALVTDSGLRHLANLTSLRHLALKCSHVTDLGLQHLHALCSLHLLTLTGARLTDDGLSHLQHQPYLQSLTLGSCRISEVGLSQLGHFPFLTHLHADSILMSNPAMDILEQDQNLQALILTGFYQVGFTPYLQRDT